MESAYAHAMRLEVVNFDLNHLRIGTVAKFEINLAYK